MLIKACVRTLNVNTSMHISCLFVIIIQVIDTTIASTTNNNNNYNLHVALSVIHYCISL